MALFLLHSSISSINLSRSRSQSRSCVLHVFSVGGRGRPAICLFKFSCHRRDYPCTHTHTHIPAHTHTLAVLEEKQIIRAQANCFVCFTLSVAFPPSFANRWALLMKSAVPVSICVRNEFSHFSKRGNLQSDLRKRRKPQFQPSDSLFFFFFECIPPLWIWV